MNVISTNSVGDNYFVSSGNEDDSRVRIWSVSSLSLIKEITFSDNTSFYALNLLTFESVFLSLNYRSGSK